MREQWLMQKIESSKENPKLVFFTFTKNLLKKLIKISFWILNHELQIFRSKHSENLEAVRQILRPVQHVREKKFFLAVFGKYWQVAKKVRRPKVGSRDSSQFPIDPENLDIVA
jgi:hypothetical protein